MRKLPNLITLYLPLAIIVLVIMGPLAYLFLSSIMTDTDSIMFGKSLQIPGKLTLDPYVTVFRVAPLGQAVIDGIAYSLSSAVLVTLVTSVSGYGFSFFRFVGKTISLKTYIFAQLIPGYAFLIPIFIYTTTAGIHDTYWALIFTMGGATIPFALWMAFSFYKLVPAELHDSAIIDGCSELQIFRKVFLPLIAPGIVAVFVYVFITSWTQFLWPLILTGVNVKAVPVVLSLLWTDAEWRGSFNSVMAGGMISLIPPVIVALVFQRWLIKGLTAGAVKG